MDKSEIVTCDSNNLICAYKKAVKSSKEKQSNKKFSLHHLDEILKAQDELHNRTWKITNVNPFLINERGHKRKIQGNTPYDRMIVHSYIDNSLEPEIRNKLIYDNYASQVSKGTSLARERFENFIHKAYREYGNNEFYVLLIDFAKFYDNVQHEKLKSEIFKSIEYEEFHDYMITQILDSFKVDVSYMDDSEYDNCINEKYSSLEHLNEKNTGERFMRKSLNIGNQGSQVFSVFYPTRIDNYCKIVKRAKYYGRYMDDIFILSNNKEWLKDILSNVKEIATDMGLFVHENKTQIFKVSKNFKFLNRIYRLTNSGHLCVKLSNSTYNRERRKLKRFKHLLDEGKIDSKKIENQYLSWIGGNKKYI